MINNYHNITNLDKSTIADMLNSSGSRIQNLTIEADGYMGMMKALIEVWLDPNYKPTEIKQPVTATCSPLTAKEAEVKITKIATEKNLFPF